MTFWKSSKRREGAISDPKILVADLSTSRKKRTTVFGNKGGAGEGVTGRLEVFQKFIQNGTVRGIMANMVLCVIPGQGNSKILNLVKSGSFDSPIFLYIPNDEKTSTGHLV